MGIFGGLILTSAMAACGSSSDDTSSPSGGGGSGGAINHGGSGGKGGSTAHGGSGGSFTAGTGGKSGGEAGTTGSEAGSTGVGETAGAGGEGGGVTTTQFKVHIENVSGSAILPTAISPGVYAVHSTPDPFFTKDAADRGKGLAALASDADPTALAAATKAAAGVESSGVFNTPTGASAAAALKPGDAYDFTITAEPGDTLSIASMFGETNDAFFAPAGTGIKLFDNNGKALASQDVSAQIQLWDAGVEKDEAPGMGATQAPRQSAKGAGSAEGVASKRLDGTRSLPLAQGIASFTVTQTGGVFSIVVKNISAQSGAIYTPLSPFYVATHSSAFKLFNEGQVAPTGLESLAEDGDPTALVAATATAPGIGLASAQGTGLLQPGATVTLTVTPTKAAPRLSLATMLGQTNDVFLATSPAGVALLDDQGAPRDVATVQAELNASVVNYDAGTEANQVPGAGADIKANQSSNNQGAVDTNNQVRRYSDDTNDLAGPNLGGFASVTVKQGAAGAFDVIVTNTSSGAFVGTLSPVVWAVHDGSTQLFQAGKAVSAGLQSLAEDGVSTALVTELTANTHVAAKGVQGLAPIASGANFSFSVVPDAAHPRLSLVSMIVPSNDTFLALGETGVALLDSTGTPRADSAIAADIAAALAAYDAGTEANQAGAAGPAMAGTTLLGSVTLQPAPNTGAADGNGLVRLLTSSVWTYPTASSLIKVTITPQ